MNNGSFFRLNFEQETVNQVKFHWSNTSIGREDIALLSMTQASL